MYSGKISISDISRCIRNREYSVEELVHFHIEQAEKNKSNNAFITYDFERALVKAQEADTRIAKGEILALDGVVVGIKDNFCTYDLRTTAGSKMLENFVPKYESTVTERLFASGAIMLGKLNMDEFAMGSANLNSYFGHVLNPWKREGKYDTVPGGSSGGSAVAVADASVIASLGSDTGGSVRQPASFTGIVGVKPTYGRCSRYGIVAFASSLDQAGVCTNNVQDSSTVLQQICGYDHKDSTSVDVPVPDFGSQLGKGVKGLKVGIPEEYFSQQLSDEVRKACEQVIENLRSEGAEIVHISLPHTKYALLAYYIIAPAEASTNLARYDGVRYGLRVYDEGDSLDDMYEKTRAVGFGDEVKSRILMGTYALSSGYYDAYYRKAQKIRRLVAEHDFQQSFKEVDLIFSPVAPTVAFDLGQEKSQLDMYANDIFTIPASLAGLPAISIPIGFSSSGLPIGGQLIANLFDEVTMYRVASNIEQSVDFLNLVKEHRL